MSENIKEFNLIVDNIANAIETGDKELFMKHLISADNLMKKCIKEADIATAMKLTELGNKLTELLDMPNDTH